MNLQTVIDNELNRLHSAAGEPIGKRHVSVAVDGGRFECALTAVDSLACAFESVALQTDRLADVPAQQLLQTAESLRTRMSYLLEPISTLEMDQESCAIQLRSRPPTRDANATTYYELLVQRGEIRLSRYRKPRGQPRCVVPATVTREVFQRLAADFLAAVAE
ncbi:MAG: hypothetical protein ACC628_04195 [Pirellulaceae bacterium]